MSKFVFDVQGCRALTFALARLSGYVLPYQLVPTVGDKTAEPSHPDMQRGESAETKTESSSFRHACAVITSARPI